MIDDFTLSQCKQNKEILHLKIKNLEHGIQQAEKIISESQISSDSLTFLRRKISDSIQDLEVLYLLDKNSTKL
tara:strand:+ start:328 stop:546 length:219 start_codon:yes stop_codon:yes gene_type:complete